MITPNGVALFYKLEVVKVTNSLDTKLNPLIKISRSAIPTNIEGSRLGIFELVAAIAAVLA